MSKATWPKPTLDLPTLPEPLLPWAPSSRQTAPLGTWVVGCVPVEGQPFALPSCPPTTWPFWARCLCLLSALPPWGQGSCCSPVTLPTTTSPDSHPPPRSLLTLPVLGETLRPRHTHDPLHTPCIS